MKQTYCKYVVGTILTQVTTIECEWGVGVMVCNSHSLLEIFLHKLRHVL